MANDETRRSTLAGRLGVGSIGLWVAGVTFGALALWQVWDWRAGRDDAEARFFELAEAGEGALSRVERVASFGSWHLEPGQTAYYRHRFPTSGPHDPAWIEPGVYTTVQSPNKLVHSIERGMIVVYYDVPADDVMKTLYDWSALFNGPWSGLVVVPSPGLDDGVVLTAWVHLLRLDPFDPAAAAAFIDRFRGRGPKSPER